MWRRAREFILKKIGIQPKKHTMTTMHEKVRTALQTINATEQETIQIIRLTTLAKQRSTQRRQYGASGSLQNDSTIHKLEEEAIKLLGEKRATKFFQLCNDPYY
ncbi:MAG: hypothetical protein WCW13_01025 [archaeon]|jgi:hypothetical protein